MTVSVEDTKELFVGDGVQTAYPFDFKIDLEEELRVFFIASDGAETPLTLDVDYTVELHLQQNTNPGGVVTFTDPPGEGVVLVIIRDLEFVRGAEFTSSVPPHIIESELDRVTMYAQQLGEQLDRTIKVSPAQVLPLPVLPNAQTRAGKLVGFDDEGLPALYTLVDGSVVGPPGAVLASRVELSDPAVFRQESNGDWSHTTCTATFIWTINGAEVESREVEVEIDGLGAFTDPGLVEPGDEFTSTLSGGSQLLSITSEFQGQREYVQFASVSMPADDGFEEDSFTPAWGTGEFGTPPEDDVTWTLRAGMVSLTVSSDALVAASSSTALTWDAASMPVDIWPSIAREVPCVLVSGDAIEVAGYVLLGTDGSAVFSVQEAAGLDPAGFHATQQKGLPLHWNVVYSL